MQNSPISILIGSNWTLAFLLHNLLILPLENFENNLFNESYHDGFCSKWSCLSQLLSHMGMILTYLKNGSNVEVIYLDFSKAFDKVDQNIGINSKQWNGFNHFVTGRQKVLLDRKGNFP